MDGEEENAHIEELVKLELTLDCQSNSTKDESIQSDTTAVEGFLSRWMEKSDLHGHFLMYEESGHRTATCIHCKKVFKQSKSTGNLWKHIENLHPFELKA